MQDFEKILREMSKPEIGQLKHEDMMAAAIVKAADRSVLSGWWLSVPLYIIAALMMKTFFKPGTTFISATREMINAGEYSSALFFIIVPLVFTVLNLVSIRKIGRLYRHAKPVDFIVATWFNWLIIVASLVILTIYFYIKLR